MKYCEEFAALLDPYVDGELTGEEAARVRAHLETCPGCRTYVDDALTVRAAFPDVEETEAPEGFAEGVMDAVRELEAAKAKKPGAWRYGHWKTVLLPLAACFALVVLVRGLPGGGEKRALMSAAPAAMDTAAPANNTAGEYGFSMASQPAESRMEDVPAAEEDLAAPESLEPTEAPAAAVDGLPPEPGEGYTSVLTTAASDPAGKMSGTAASPRAIHLTADQAGELLADLPYTTDEEGIRCYQMPSGDFDALLSTLAERDIVPLEETAETECLPEGYDLVYVTEE